MRTKKLIAMLLSLVLTVSLLAGIGGSALADDEVTTLTVYSQLANFSGTQGGWSSVLLKDMLGIELVIVPESDGTYQTRMESGDLGDIVVWGSNDTNYQEAVKQGLLFDWEEEDLLNEYGPYIAETFGDALDANREINSDGLLHGFGHNLALSAENHENFFYTWDIRWDLYEQLGYPEVKTLAGAGRAG